MPCPGTRTTEGSGTAGFSPALVPPARPPHHSHSHHVLCPPEQLGGQWGLNSPTCSGGKEPQGPGQRGSGQAERTFGTSTASWCLHATSGAGTRQATSRRKEHPHCLKSCEHLWWFPGDLPHQQDHQEPSSNSKGIWEITNHLPDGSLPLLPTATTTAGTAGRDGLPAPTRQQTHKGGACSPVTTGGTGRNQHHPSCIPSS